VPCAGGWLVCLFIAIGAMVEEGSAAALVGQRTVARAQRRGAPHDRDRGGQHGVGEPRGEHRGPEPGPRGRSAQLWLLSLGVPVDVLIAPAEGLGAEGGVVSLVPKLPRTVESTSAIMVSASTGTAMPSPGSTPRCQVRLPGDWQASVRPCAAMTDRPASPASPSAPESCVAPGSPPGHCSATLRAPCSATLDSVRIAVIAEQFLPHMNDHVRR
jgi:hypothetical protein